MNTLNDFQFITNQQADRAFNAGVIASTGKTTTVVHLNKEMIALTCEIKYDSKGLNLLIDCFNMGIRSTVDEETAKICKELFNTHPMKIFSPLED